MIVLIVDDHTLVRRGLAHIVRDTFRDAEAREAGSAEEALALLKDEPVDIALVDVRMPDRDGLDLLREIKANWPTIPVIMLTTYDLSRYVRTALAEGAAGYMLKDSTPEDLDQAIRVALSGGGNVLSPQAIRSLFEEVDADQGDASRRAQANLTQRELDILALLAEGKSNRDISRALYLSEKTVKAHIAAIFRKLGVTNRTQAAIAGVNMGMGAPRYPTDRELDASAERFPASPKRA